MKIYFVRHPQTVWNKEKRMQGWLDSPLTEEGKAVAHMLGEKLKGKGIKRIVTSDLGRCKETASIINGYLSVPLAESKELREQNYGRWGGESRTDAILKQIDENPNFAPPGGESQTHMHTRVMGGIMQAEDDTLIVTHEGCMQAVLSGILHKPVGHESCKMKRNEIVVIERINDESGERFKVLAREEA